MLHDRTPIVQEARTNRVISTKVSSNEVSNKQRYCQDKRFRRMQAPKREGEERGEINSIAIGDISRIIMLMKIKSTYRCGPNQRDNERQSNSVGSAIPCEWQIQNRTDGIGAADLVSPRFQMGSLSHVSYAGMAKWKVALGGSK